MVAPSFPALFAVSADVQEPLGQALSDLGPLFRAMFFYQPDQLLVLILGPNPAIPSIHYICNYPADSTAQSPSNSSAPAPNATCHYVFTAYPVINNSMKREGFLCALIRLKVR
jgi:hypothetical protein